MFTWHLFNQTVSRHQVFPKPRQSSQITGLNPMALWPQSVIYDSYLKQWMRYLSKCMILKNRCKSQQHNEEQEPPHERKGIIKAIQKLKFKDSTFVNEDVYYVYGEVNRKLNGDFCHSCLYEWICRLLGLALMLIFQGLIRYTMSFLSSCEIITACISSWDNLCSPFIAVSASSAAALRSSPGVFSL